MQRLPLHPFAAAILLMCSVMLGTTSAADTSADTIANRIGPYLGERTILVARIQVAEVPIERLADRIAALIPEAKSDMEQGQAAAKQLQANLLAAGADDIYVLVAKEGFPQNPVAIIVPRSPKSQPETINDLLAGAPLLPGNAVGIVTDDAVILSSPNMKWGQLTNQDNVHPQLATAFAAVADHAIQVVLIPSHDDRRVINELLPTLPQELGGGPSSDLTRGVQWAALGVGKQETLELNLVIQSADEASAKAVQGIWKAGLDYIVDHDPITKAAVGSLRAALPKLDMIQEVLVPKVTGDQLTLQLSEQDQSIQKLLAALQPPLEDARNRARRIQSMNNLKQIALAMHNFYDTYKRFPAIGTFDATGQPLLSWRVHLLPFVEQGELYDQFHLDEPWDSAHNKSLIAKMPVVFACPQSKHPVSDGLATYRLVVGEGTAFPGREGIELKSIIDGTSNTIMAVEVDDEHAVIWTKPEGLPFNAENPLKGIGGQFPGGFNAASCDGAVHFIEQMIDAQKLRLLLLRNDGNPVQW